VFRVGVLWLERRGKRELGGQALCSIAGGSCVDWPQQVDVRGACDVPVDSTADQGFSINGDSRGNSVNRPNRQLRGPLFQ